MIFLVSSVAAFPGRSMAADGPDALTRDELALYLALAEASEQAYDDSREGLLRSPSGCVALVKEDDAGNLIVAFRGSMLGDRRPKHRFSNFGGAIIRRNYRDWVATNLKQTTGFLPRQYIEAAEMAETLIQRHPPDKRVYLTGHSKGGGAATYAFAAAYASPGLTPEQTGRLHAVTFNAAVVRERNWDRMFRMAVRKHGGQARDKADSFPPDHSVIALCMKDDPVSRIAASEERPLVKRIIIAPTAELAPYGQHGIDAVIRELKSMAEEGPTHRAGPPDADGVR